MKNRIAKVALISLGVILLVGGKAFAAFELNTYARMFMTNASGNVVTSSQANFGWNEQPWVYIQFYGNQGSNNIGGSLNGATWTWDGTPTDKSFFKFYSTNKNELWIGFSESYWQNSMRQAGDWTVSALSLLNDKTSGGCGNLKSFGDTVNFKVNAVPEPVSALLFLTGGAAIAAFRRKKA
jgi:hypothetical protein